MTIWKSPVVRVGLPMLSFVVAGSYYISVFLHGRNKIKDKKADAPENITSRLPHMKKQDQASLHVPGWADREADGQKDRLTMIGAIAEDDGNTGQAPEMDSFPALPQRSLEEEYELTVKNMDLDNWSQKRIQRPKGFE